MIKENFVEQVNNSLSAKGYELPTDNSPTELDFEIGYSIEESVQNWISDGDLQIKRNSTIKTTSPRA